MKWQKVEGYIKLQIPAGKATPATAGLVSRLLDSTALISLNLQTVQRKNSRSGRSISFRLSITVYNDRSFSFVTKTPPAAVLIKSLQDPVGSGVPNKNKVATITKAQLQEIAELKMPDLNAATAVESAMSMVAGTCRSMGGSSRRVGTEFRLHIQSAVRMNRFEGQNVNIRDALKQNIK